MFIYDANSNQRHSLSHSDLHTHIHTHTQAAKYTHSYTSPVHANSTKNAFRVLVICPVKEREATNHLFTGHDKPTEIAVGKVRIKIIICERVRVETEIC